MYDVSCVAWGCVAAFSCTLTHACCCCIASHSYQFSKVLDFTGVFGMLIALVFPALIYERSRNECMKRWPKSDAKPSECVCLCSCFGGGAAVLSHSLVVLQPLVQQLCGFSHSLCGGLHCARRCHRPTTCGRLLVPLFSCCFVWRLAASEVVFFAHQLCPHCVNFTNTTFFCRVWVGRHSGCLVTTCDTTCNAAGSYCIVGAQQPHSSESALTQQGTPTHRDYWRRT